jgi:hemerythrin
MRIFYGFYAKKQEFVRIRLEGRFPNAFKNSEDSYAQIKEVITRLIQKINFHFYCRNSITPSTN